MKKDSSKKKYIIYISILVVFIVAILITIILNTTNSDEKSVLYCYKERDTENGLKQLMSYEVFKSSEKIRLVQNNEIKFSDEVYKLMIAKGYDINFFKEYFTKSIESGLDEALSKYEDSIKNNINVEGQKISVVTEYIITEKNKNELSEILKLDFYEKSISDIQTYYEGGGMSCEVK